jgi:MFS family permease
VAVSLAVLALILSGLRLESLGGSGIQSYSLQNMASLFMASAVIILLMSFVRLIFLSETYRPSNDDRATFSSVIAKNLAPLKKGNVRPLTLAYMLHDAALSMVLFLIPLYATRAGMAAFTLSTMFAVQIALTFILQIPFGRLADKKGRTWTILVSFVLEAIFAALLVVYANPYYAFAIYTVWIAAGQMDAPAQSALLADLTKIEERSSMMGGFGAVTTLAAIPAPIIGGFLFDVNLPLLFYICSTLLAIAAATMLYYRRHLLREPSHEVSL